VPAQIKGVLLVNVFLGPKVAGLCRANEVWQQRKYFALRREPDAAKREGAAALPLAAGLSPGPANTWEIILCFAKCASVVACP